MQLSATDRWLCGAEAALRTLSGGARAGRPSPAAALPEDAGAAPLTPAERKLSGALMRVNHVGEVCAQALYQAQSLTTRDDALRRHLTRAAAEELDHLAWTEERLAELGDRTSLLNPLWFAGAFAIGLAAGRLGDPVSLGFVVETEAQVEQHLASHLDRLPAGDAASRAIVAQMKDDEVVHGAAARTSGGIDLPLPVRLMMRAAAKVMTVTAHRL